MELPAFEEFVREFNSDRYDKQRQLLRLQRPLAIQSELKSAEDVVRIIEITYTEAVAAAQDQSFAMLREYHDWLSQHLKVRD